MHLGCVWMLKNVYVLHLVLHKDREMAGHRNNMWRHGDMESFCPYFFLQNSNLHL